VLSTFLSIGVPFFQQGNFSWGRKASEKNSGNNDLDGNARYGHGYGACHARSRATIVNNTIGQFNDRIGRNKVASLS